MSNVLVELSEMARQISAQLDSRAAKLELLIQEADQKLAALNAAMGQPIPPGPPNPPAQSLPSPAAARPEPELDPQHARIYSLADEGHSPGQIAQQLARPHGEIELILALRPRSP